LRAVRRLAQTAFLTFLTCVVKQRKTFEKLTVGAFNYFLMAATIIGQNKVAAPLPPCDFW